MSILIQCILWSFGFQIFRIIIAYLGFQMAKKEGTVLAKESMFDRKYFGI